MLIKERYNLLYVLRFSTEEVFKTIFWDKLQVLKFSKVMWTELSLILRHMVLLGEGGKYGSG